MGRERLRTNWSKSIRFVYRLTAALSGRLVVLLGVSGSSLMQRSEHRTRDPSQNSKRPPYMPRPLTFVIDVGEKDDNTCRYYTLDYIFHRSWIRPKLQWRV